MYPTYRRMIVNRRFWPQECAGVGGALDRRGRCRVQMSPCGSKPAALAYSSGAEAPNALPPAVPGGATPTLDATQLPATGVIYLDRMGDTSVVTNTVTYEKVKLQGAWDIQYDTDGSFAVVFRDDGEQQEVRDIDDLMSKSVFQGVGELDMVIVETKGGVSRHYSLDAVAAKQRRAQVTIELGATAASHQHEVYVFRRPRMGDSRLFWGLTQFYRLFKLTSFRGIPSK